MLFTPSPAIFGKVQLYPIYLRAAQKFYLYCFQKIFPTSLKTLSGGRCLCTVISFKQFIHWKEKVCTSTQIPPHSVKKRHAATYFSLVSRLFPDSVYPKGIIKIFSKDHFYSSHLAVQFIFCSFFLSLVIKTKPAWFCFWPEFQSPGFDYIFRKK